MISRKRAASIAAMVITASSWRRHILSCQKRMTNLLLTTLGAVVTVMMVLILN